MGGGLRGGGRPTSRRRWSRLVLLRVPMMRRPIFLAYHTELSMLLVAAAAAAAVVKVEVEVVCRLLCASSRSCCRLRGWRRWCWLESRRWEGGFTPPCVPPSSSSSSSSQTQTGRLQRSWRRWPAAETRRGRPPAVSYEQRRETVSGSRLTPDLTWKRARGASGGGLTCRGERASLSRRRESSRSASLRLCGADSNNRLQGWREERRLCVSQSVCVFKESAGREEISPLISSLCSLETSRSSFLLLLLVLLLLFLPPRQSAVGLVELTSVLLHSADSQSLFQKPVSRGISRLQTAELSRLWRTAWWSVMCGSTVTMVDPSENLLMVAY